MDAIYHDAEARKLYVFDAEGKVRVLDALQPASAAVEPTKPTQHPKKGKQPKRNKRTEKDLADEVEARVSRSRLDPSVTKEIEDRLIAGDTVASILEKVEVSAPTIYVIKARLKSEGRLV